MEMTRDPSMNEHSVLRRSEAVVPFEYGNRTLAEDALDQIRQLILTGAVMPGDRLRLEELAERLNLSHTPIREALRHLEQLGLVQNIPHRGARVVPITGEELKDLYEARLALEPLAVQRAAEHFTEELFQSGLRVLDRLHKAESEGEFSAMWKAHTDFHFLLYRASHSEWLLRSIGPMWERAQCYRIGYERMMATREEGHLKILEACRRHEGEHANRKMHNHLAVMGNQMISFLSKGAGVPLPLVEEIA
jgi:DNA-binding GntR family transcriptional regulator